MSIADGLMGRGEGTKVLARIDPGDTATLFFELGGSKVCELYVCWEVLFFSLVRNYMCDLHNLAGIICKISG